LSVAVEPGSFCKVENHSLAVVGPNGVGFDS
jgi:hypothetical protein